jgi:anti-anti-sigma regulatory factor
MLHLRERLLAEGGQIMVTGLQPRVEYVLRLTETYELLTTAAVHKAA